MASTRIRAAVDRDSSLPLAIESIVLAAPGPDQVRVAIEACAVCHSDLSFVEGEWASSRPAVWGHEAAGVVTDLGPSTDGQAAPPPGTRVVVSLLRSCGACRACRVGHTVHCTGSFPGPEPLTDADGDPVHQGMGVGAFAEAVVVHRSQVVVLPEDIASTDGALLGCGVLTGVGSVRHTTSVRPGDTVAVVGTGGVGLNAVQGARLSGAEDIVAIDPSGLRRAAAERLGATHQLDPTPWTDSHDGATALQDLLGHLADHVIVATGAPAAASTGLELAASGGTLVLVGMPEDGTELTIDPTALAATGRRIAGSKMGSACLADDIDWLIGHLRAGALELGGLVTDTFSLDEVNTALDRVRAGAGLRNVLLPQAQPSRPQVSDTPVTT